MKKSDLSNSRFNVISYYKMAAASGQHAVENIVCNDILEFQVHEKKFNSLQQN